MKRKEGLRKKKEKKEGQRNKNEEWELLDLYRRKYG